MKLSIGVFFLTLVLTGAGCSNTQNANHDLSSSANMRADNIATKQRSPTTSIVDSNENLGLDQAFKKNLEFEDLARALASPDSHTACIPVKKVYCTISGCEAVPAKTFNLIGGNSLTPTFSRCDRMGCDTYDAIIEQSGEYKNLQMKEPKGVIFKMAYNTIDKKYLEIATLGLDSYITYGYCLYDFGS